MGVGNGGDKCGNVILVRAASKPWQEMWPVPVHRLGFIYFCFYEGLQVVFYYGDTRRDDLPGASV